MKVHTRFSFVALALGATLSSCVYYPHPVPEMPYSAARRTVTRVVDTPKPVEAEPEMAPEPAVAPKPAKAPDTKADPFPAPVKKAPKVAEPAKPKTSPTPAPVIRKPSSAITKPSMSSEAFPTPVVKPETPKPVVTSAPAPTPTPVKKPSATADMSKITNQGPIPVATRVEGDPTRVYNPLDPSKTIRIIDKNGNVFPSGKELKVRGTNFHFYVP